MPKLDVPLDHLGKAIDELLKALDCLLRLSQGVGVDVGLQNQTARTIQLLLERAEHVQVVLSHHLFLLLHVDALLALLFISGLALNGVDDQFDELKLV